MVTKQKDENSSFRGSIKNYRKHFGLTQGDLANLLRVDEARYSGLESGRRTLDIGSADKIAHIYGLRYFEMGNPDQLFPKFEKLPLITQEAILNRESSKIKLKNTDLNLGKHIDKWIREGKLNRPITTKELWELLPPKTKKICTSTQITSMLKKAPRSNIIIKVGKNGREHFFQLKEFAGK